MDPEIERSPDKQPSRGAMYIEDRGGDVIWVLSVRDLGALVLRGFGPDGTEHGVSIFTKDEIQFDPR